MNDNFKKNYKFLMKINFELNRKESTSKLITTIEIGIASQPQLVTTETENNLKIEFV